MSRRGAGSGALPEMSSRGSPPDGGDDEDAVGFGLVGGDGVGEGFAVASDLVVEDVGELAGGLRGEVEEGESWCRTRGFRDCCWRSCGVEFGCGFRFGGVFFCGCGGAGYFK